MVNIRVLAESDLGTTLEDKENGLGWDITFINPDTDFSQTVQGQYHRISADIDPDTGMQVKVKKSSITVRTSSIIGEIKRNWKVLVVDISNNTIQGIVASPPLPDYTLGMTTIFIREELFDE